MKIGNIEIKSKVFLAPLAGYTNKVYREIASSFGAGVVTGEMVSAKGLLYNNDKTWDMLKVGKEGVCSLQLFGYDISDMVAAAKILDQKTDCDIIDINMGCPVRKVVNNKSGSYLMLEEKHASEMVRSIVKEVKKPVTVKIRAGYDHEHINCVSFAKAMEEAGASAITIHGRCKSDLYRGKANWDYIKAVKEAVSIPVIGNGDIKTKEDAKKMLEYTGCDAVAIGRASLGNPWIFQEINAYLEGSIYVGPTNDEKIEMLIDNYKRLKELKGEMLALLEMRSLAAYYIKGFSNSKEYKRALVSVKTEDEFLEIIDKYLRG